MFLSGLIDGGINLVGNWLNNEAAEDRQNAAQGWSAEQYAKRYQTQVKDLEAAGLNPMLAYAQSPGASPTGQAAPTTNLASGVMSAYRQAEMNNAQVANIEADTKNKAATAKLIEGQAAQAWSTAYMNQQQLGVISANAQKIMQETANLVSERARIEETIKLLGEQRKNAIQEGKNLVEVNSQIKATVANLRARTTLFDFDIQAAEFSDNFGRIANEYKEVIDVIQSMIPSVGSLLDKFMKRGRVRRTRETRTVYDADGNPSGGMSREVYEE